MTGKNRNRDGRRTTFGNVRGKAAFLGASTLLVVIGLGACTSHDAHPRATSDRPSVSTSSTTTTAPSTTSSTDRESADRAAVGQAYVEFWHVVDTIQRSGLPQTRWPSELSRVAAEPLYSASLQNEINEIRVGLRVYGGTITRGPQFAQPIAGAGAAVFKDCLDTSKTGQEVIASGEKKTIGVVRAPTLNYAKRGSDGIWRISRIEFMPKETC
jgi:hypothetical protein